MAKVPITFEYKGKSYSGHFESVTGGGGAIGDHWHLMINNFYYGQLHYSGSSGGWLFHGNDFEDLSDYFEAYMIGWFQ